MNPFRRVWSLFVKRKKDGLTASEALYGFMGWLTTRDDAVTFSAHHNSAEAADLVERFCRANMLTEPRDNWADFLIRPTGSDFFDPIGLEERS